MMIMMRSRDEERMRTWSLGVEGELVRGPVEGLRTPRGLRDGAGNRRSRSVSARGL